jgi:hypothetical protein
VVVWLRVDDELRPEACSDGGPPPAALPAGVLPAGGQAMPPLPDAHVSVPVVHQGEPLGAISIRMPKAEPLRPAGEQLVADVASQAGLVLSNVGLVEDLRASRQRLVTAQDEERRRLERNIHDGAQQDLVALAIKVRLADMTVDEDPAQARQILGEVQTDTAGALENLRDLARGIYPPLLADLGLAAALNAQAGKSAVPVAVEADGIGRFPGDTEAAVFLLPRGAAEHHQVRPRVQYPDLPAGAERDPALHRVRQRNRLRHPPHPHGIGPAEHGRPACRARRPARGAVRAQPGHHHHRAPPRPRHQRQSLAHGSHGYPGRCP